MIAVRLSIKCFVRKFLLCIIFNLIIIKESGSYFEVIR